MSAALHHYMVIGHSHAGTMKRGFAQWQEKLPKAADRLSCDFVLVRELTQGRTASGKAPKEENLNDEVVPAIRLSASRRKPDIVITSLLGNAHSVISIPQHLRPFDLIVPGHEFLPVIDGAEIVPYGALRQALRTGLQPRMADYFNHLNAEIPDTPIWVVPPPPPAASAEHIRKNARGLAPLIQSSGISPAPLRLKLWLVNLHVLAELAAAFGARLIDLPLVVFDLDGYLQTRFLDTDPTHGNAAYGHVLMSHLHRVHRQELNQNG